jgi:hypothetical protein
LRLTSRLHSLAIGGMGISALAGIVLMLAFVSVRWPGATGRYLKVAFVFTVLIFLTSCSLAVLAAARDSYATRPGLGERDA